MSRFTASGLDKYLIWYLNAVMHLKDSHEMANSVSPDKTAPKTDSDQLAPVSVFRFLW